MLFKLFQSCTFQVFNLFTFSEILLPQPPPPRPRQKNTWSNGKSLNPLQNSSTFILFLSLMLWARDTIPTLNESQDLELLAMYSVFKNLVRFWNNRSFSFKEFKPVFSFYNRCVLLQLECVTSSLECRAAGLTGEKILFSLILIPNLLLDIDNICIEM